MGRVLTPGHEPNSEPKAADHAFISSEMGTNLGRDGFDVEEARPLPGCCLFI
jgi:hypothetical protein